MKKIFLIISVLFLTGCSYYYNDINNLAIINEIAIDHEDNYKVYIKVLSNNQENENKIYFEEGKSLNECFTNLNNKLTKKLYLTHLDLLVLSNNIKKKEINEIIKFFFNESSSRNIFDTIIVNKITENFLKIDSTDINNLVDLSAKTNGIAIKKTFDNMIKDILNYNLSYITYIDSNLQEVKGIKEIYNSDTILSKEESIAINIILNNLTNFTTLINDNSYKLENLNTFIKVTKKEIKIDVNLTISGNEFEKKIVENYLKKLLNNFIKENNTNYFDYLKEKYNISNNVKFDLNIKINLINNSSGDYFV